MADRDIKAGPYPADVIQFWRSKNLKPGFDYRDTWEQEHSIAFSVAKVLRLDVLEALQDELDRAVEQGVPYKQFAKQVKPRMESLGWWAPHEVTDPETGKKARVDPPKRLKLVYDTNLRTSRQAAFWERAQRTKKTRPYLLYQVGPSERHREQHLAWHGLLLPIDDEFWQTHMPSNGYGCKCFARTVSQREADELAEEGILAPDPEPELDDDGNPTGHVVDRRIPVKREAPPIELVPWVNKRTGATEFVPRGIDPGFAHRPGEGRRIYLDERLGEDD